MIELGFLGILLFIAAAVAWRRRYRKMPATECGTLHATALSVQEGLGRGSNGKMVLNVDEALSVYNDDCWLNRSSQVIP